MKFTINQVAQYMIDEIEVNEIVYQEYIVHEIEEKFGESFVYLNDNGNPAISKEVLKEFANLKKDKNIEWDRNGRCWSFT